MTNFKNWLLCFLLLAFGNITAKAFTTNDAVTIYDAYNTAFRDGSGYYSGWWTGAEEIEMAEDAYDNLPTAARKTSVANACSQFISHHGSNWFASGASYNEYNDDIAWAVIAMSRGYLITGNTTFRDVAKNNWDGMYNRAWDTNFFGAGLFWRQSDKQSKNACIECPATIAACYLYSIYGDTNYLNKAQAIYGFNRKYLLNTNTGAVYDNIGTNGTIGSFSLTYNQGTCIGAANFLYRITGLPFYYQDAILIAKYTQKSMSSSAGIMPEYGSASDLSGFNGIFARWMARFAKDQNLWAAYGPWLTTNANAAWSVRNGSNLAWQKWATSLGTNAPDSWGCSASVVVMQVADPSPADSLQITPTAGFTAATQRSLPPAATSVDLVLSNTSIASLNWSLINTSAWLSVSASNGTLPAATASNITVSLIPSATTNLPAGRYFTSIQLTNLASGVISSRIFTLAISSGDAPIALTGCNAAILAPNTATAVAPGATAFDMANNYCFYQAGLNGGMRGLPPDGTFTSQFDNKTMFQLKPYGSTNSLMMGSIYPNSGTLTLVTPRAYNSISLLACSAGGGGIGTFVLNFTNGAQSQALNFTAQDWFNNATNIAIQGIGRLKLTATFGADDTGGAVNPRMFHTTINLAALGINQTIGSITFTKPAGSTTGIFAVSGTVMPDAPAMVLQPVSQTNNLPAQGATFYAVASGIPPLNYQWYYSSNGNPGTYFPLASQINTNLVLSPVLQSTNAGSYYVVVTNNFGSITSSVATLTIYREPLITQQPVPTNVFRFVGSTNIWTVAANAALPVNYYWTRNGTNLPNATSPTFQLNNLQTNNSGNYSVVISNAFGATTSSIVTLTVMPAPTYPFGQAVLADKPLGYWRLDEVSGTVAHDYVMGNNGTYTPTVQLGQPGNKLIDPHTVARFGSLAANNSCVTNIAALSFATSGNAAFSIEAWVNGGTQTTDAGLVTKGYGSGGEQFNLDCGGTSHAFRFFVRDASGGVHLASTTVVPNNQWHHLVGVCDSANGYVRLYVDSTNANPGTITANSGILSSITPMSIGSRQSGAGTTYDNQFVGYIEEVAIYGYAMSAGQVTAHYQAVTNRPPTFIGNPFTIASANAGQSYSASLTTKASDPNGDTITFAKVSGPAWLSVASNGSLGGTSLSADVGNNGFMVSATDLSGLSSTATMNLEVLPAPPIVTSAALQGNNLLLNWAGGIAPYQIQFTTDLLNPSWQNLGAPVFVNSLLVPPTNAMAFYRIYGL